MSSRQERREPWKLPYQKRKSVSKKFKDTEIEIQKAKQSQNWTKVKRLKYILRKVWWGIKRYKNK